MKKVEINFEVTLTDKVYNEIFNREEDVVENQSATLLMLSAKLFSEQAEFTNGITATMK